MNWHQDWTVSERMLSRLADAAERAAQAAERIAAAVERRNDWEMEEPPEPDPGELGDEPAPIVTIDGR